MELILNKAFVEAMEKSGIRNISLQEANANRRNDKDIKWPEPISGEPVYNISLEEARVAMRQVKESENA